MILIPPIPALPIYNVEILESLGIFSTFKNLFHKIIFSDLVPSFSFSRIWKEPRTGVGLQVSPGLPLISFHLKKLKRKGRLSMGMEQCRDSLFLT